MGHDPLPTLFAPVYRFPKFQGFARAKISKNAVFYSMLRLLFAVSVAANAQQQGLGNATKTFADPSKMTGLEATDRDEIARSWGAAIVRIPDGNGGSRVSTMADLTADMAQENRKLPTVIYLHGCSGIWQGTYERIKFYADHGYLVIAPASFARQKYPKSCDVATSTGGLYRGTLAMRQADAGHAIEMVRKFPFVDPARIVLAGLSQGAIATATFKAVNEDQKAAARVVEGWTCNAGWPEYQGINAGPDEPVLALVAKNDPWLQNEWTKGDCGRFLTPSNGSVSVVYDQGELAWRHELLDLGAPRKKVMDFLNAELGLSEQ